MKEKIRNFLKKILYFLKKSYPKPIVYILFGMFLISISLAFGNTFSEKINVEQKISEQEKKITNEYNKQVEEYERKLEEYEKYKKSPEYGKSIDLSWVDLIILEPKDTLEKRLSDNPILESLRTVKNSPFLILWAKNVFNENSLYASIIFVLTIFVILTVPIIKAFFLFGLYIKKQFQAMTVFQKYLIGLIFGILIVLILILLKLF